MPERDLVFKIRIENVKNDAVAQARKALRQFAIDAGKAQSALAGIYGRNEQLPGLDGRLANVSPEVIHPLRSAGISLEAFR